MQGSMQLSLEREFDLTGLRSINIALIGHSGAGKSSFIGMAELIFNGRLDIELQDTGCEGTIHLETYFEGKGFQVYDSRGFLGIDEELTKELKMILSGQIKPGTVIKRPIISQYKEGYEAPVSDRCHVVVFTMNAKDPRIKLYIEHMKDLKTYCTEKGLEIIFMFTSDNLKNRGRDSEVRRLASIIGADDDRLFYVVNHIALNSTDKLKTDYESQWEILQLLDTAILAGERYIKSKKQLELNEFMESSKADAHINKTVAHIFKEISQEHELPEHHLHNFLEYLESESVNTVKNLKDVWNDLDPSRMPHNTMQDWIKEKLGLSV